jgi:hypothetical protein
MLIQAASGPGTFGTIIVEGFGFSPLDTTLLQAMPSSTVQVVALLAFGYMATKLPNSRLHIISLCQIFGIVGSVLLYKLPNSNKAGLMVAYCLTYGTSANVAVYYAHMAATTAGNTKKAVTSMIVFIFYSIGQLSGPHFFLANQAPTYPVCCFHEHMNTFFFLSTNGPCLFPSSVSG